MTTPTHTDPEQLLYPDSDGQPMSDNTLQFQWIVTLQGNLDAQFRNEPNVFVAGDLLWYAVRGVPAERVAPDALVAFGRPKGYRGSYKQWEENGVAPHVVFEVLSPNNTEAEMSHRLAFYERHGVEEYYLYDPDNVRLFGWVRKGRKLRPVSQMHGHVSPRLGIRFDLSGDELVIYRPDGQRFLTFVELAVQREEAEQQAKQSRKQAEQARRKAQRAERQAEEARQRVERLEAKLRELGIDPEA
jgi:Uma2 family endonuclease